MVLEDKCCNFKRHFHPEHKASTALGNHTPLHTHSWQICVTAKLHVIPALLCIVKCTLKIPVNLLACLLFPIPQEKVNIFRGYIAWFGSLLFPSKNYDTRALGWLPHSGLAGYGRITHLSIARDHRSFLGNQARTKVTEQCQHYATLIKWQLITKIYFWNPLLP